MKNKKMIKLINDERLKVGAKSEKCCDESSNDICKQLDLAQCALYSTDVCYKEDLASCFDHTLDICALESDTESCSHQNNDLT